MMSPHAQGDKQARLVGQLQKLVGWPLCR